MYKVLAILFVILALGVDASAQHVDEHAQAAASVSLRENDLALCGQPFYVNLYLLTVDVFAVGASNVSAQEYAAQVFALVRSSAEFAGNEDVFIDHIKDIPAQLVQIILEDPGVLASCADFSVALVGPP